MLRYSLVLILAVAVSGCAVNAATSGRVVIKDERTTVDVRFSDRDRVLIEDYYKPKKKRLPPGLAKRDGNLPPGLAKRDKLPPGLSSEPLPRDLESRLSSLPGSYVRVRVGQDIVLMDGKTRVVFDVLYGVGI
jgi:hypothetical protein